MTQEQKTSSKKTEINTNEHESLNSDILKDLGIKVPKSKKKRKRKQNKNKQKGHFSENKNNNGVADTAAYGIL